jgi:DNA polymerase-3 subunit epsilon
MEPIFEVMARSLVGSGDYRILRRVQPKTEYHPPDAFPKLVAAVVDVETTGTNPDRDKIIELAICLFEYDRQNGGSTKCWVPGTVRRPGVSMPSEITKITGITDEMVAGHRIDDHAANDLLDRVVLSSQEMAWREDQRHRVVALAMGNKPGSISADCWQE